MMRPETARTMMNAMSPMAPILRAQALEQTRSRRLVFVTFEYAVVVELVEQAEVVRRDSPSDRRPRRRAPAAPSGAGAPRRVQRGGDLRADRVRIDARALEPFSVALDADRRAAGSGRRPAPRSPASARTGGRRARARSSRRSPRSRSTPGLRRRPRGRSRPRSASRRARSGSSARRASDPGPGRRSARARR